MNSVAPPFWIVGCGGHARVIVGMLEEARETIEALLTDDSTMAGSAVLDIPVLSADILAGLEPARARIANGVGNRASQRGTGLAARVSIYERYRSEGFAFPSLVSRHAIIQPHVEVDEGVQVMPGAVIQTGARIAANSIINTSASVDHDSHIGYSCHIGPGAVLCGSVTIGDMTHIGAGAIILQGTRIGANVVVGAGVVVDRDLADGTILGRVSYGA